MYSLDVGALGTFLANVISGWTVTANNSDGLADYKASDLQIANVTVASSAGTASMAHKMGLAEIELKTATYYNIIEDNSVSPYTTPNRTTSANEDVTASNSFDTNSPYHLPARKGTTALYYAVVPTGSSSSTQFNSTTGTDQWSDAITATNISSGAVGHYDAYSTRVGTSTYSGSFSYHGTYLKFTMPFTGTYTIECWGASGGDGDPSRAVCYGGRGGYVKGSINLSKDDVLYIYIGNQGTRGSDTPFNGGGLSEHTWYPSSDGGGATDVRIVKHTGSDGWSGVSSLRSRIMVAAGGGGIVGALDGGAAGGLEGYRGNYSSATDYSYPTGGTQTSGGVRDNYNSGKTDYITYPSTDGGFGYGGNGQGVGNPSRYWGGGAGGSGWYGGGGGNNYHHYSSGAGGSSFISGMTGCNGWDNEINDHAGTSKPSNILVGGVYKKFTFGSTEMIDGAHSMPKPDGTGNETGHTGHGYCRITGTTATP